MTLDDFTPSRSKSVQAQITEHLRRMILCGEMPDGTRLPTTRELASRWDSNSATVHAAMAVLVKEGLLERRPKLGTFSLGAKRPLRRVAIYSASNECVEPVSSFEQSVISSLCFSYWRRKIMVDHMQDARPLRKQQQRWDELAEAISDRRIQALIAVRVPEKTINWMDRLPIVSAYVSALGRHNCVVLDPHQFIRDSLLDLARRGCRRPALINPIFIAVPDRESGGKRVIAQNDQFKATARELGMELRPEWLVCPDRWIPDRDYPEFGHHAFRRLWDSARRPDGLVVVTDTVASGVIIGISERQVKVPNELQLVLQKNAEITFYCPFPATFAVMHAKKIAAGLMEIIDRQLAGETGERILVQSEFVSP